jgi:hypothetical protein
MGICFMFNLNFEAKTNLNHSPGHTFDVNHLRLTLGYPGYLTLELCKRANGDMAKAVKRYPGRFLNLAIVPPWDVEDCLAELDRRVNELGCAGVNVQVHLGRILYSGMLEELPNLKFISSMMGGGLFAFADLITPQKSTIPGDRERFDPAASDKVRGYLKRNIFCDITTPPAWGKA